MAQSQQAEEGLSLQISLFHHLHQAVVMKDELWISQFVPGEVHSLCLLQRKRSSEEKHNSYLMKNSQKYTIVHQFAPLTSVISTLCPEKSNSSPESQRNTGQNHPARQFKSTIGFIQTELLTVSFPIDGALVEGHDVLRQGARLVAEDVFDLAQLLI